MENDRTVMEDQMSITTQCVSSPVILATPGLALQPENAGKTEPGVAKISFAKVINSS